MTSNINLFPIGTVVVLHNSTAAVMIAGYLAESEKQPGYIWDYSGFLYPIGLRDEREVYTFDHTQIEQVLAMGYQDGESFAFMKKIKGVSEMLLSQAEKQAQEKAEEKAPEDGGQE